MNPACPKCGAETDQDLVDVGIGEIPCGPRYCPACHWTEEEDLPPGCVPEA